MTASARPLLHRLWVGDPPSTEPWLANVIRSTVKGASLKDWGEDDLAPDIVNIARRTRHFVIEKDHPRHLANVARWWLLFQFGGIWLDHDVIPLVDFTSFETNAWCARLPGNGPWTSCALSLPPGHALAKDMLLRIDWSDPSTYPSPCTQVSGDGLLNRLMLQHKGYDLGSKIVPHDAAGRTMSMRRPDFVHLWATSSARVLT